MINTTTKELLRKISEAYHDRHKKVNDLKQVVVSVNYHVPPRSELRDL